jgi:putative transposase
MGDKISLSCFRRRLQHCWGDLLVNICNLEDVHIFKGVVSKDYIHMHVEYTPSLSISILVKKMKGRSSRLLEKEFPKLNKQYWGRHFWAVGYGAWSTGKITDEIVQEYLEHHKVKPNSAKGNWILE